VVGALAAWRWLGFAGSVALAAGAYRAGALPGTTAADGHFHGYAVAGLLACALGLATMAVAWWGAQAGPLGGRWVLVTAALWALPVLVAAPLASRDVYAYACQGIEASPCPWLGAVPPIWRDSPSPYGPLATLVSRLAAWVAHGHLPIAVGVLRAAALAGICLGIAYGRRLALACGVDPARAGWLALASPLVAVHAVSGAHLDVLVTGLLVAALAIAGASGAAGGGLTRAAAAGAVLGGAAAVKITALLALPFLLLVLGLRRRGPLVAALAAVAAVYAALSLVAGQGLGLLNALSHTGDLVEWTSLPTALGMTVGYLLRALGLPGGYAVAVAVARVIGLVALLAVVALAWWRARRLGGPPRSGLRPAIAATGVSFAALALLGPVFYPWYALTPLALLAVSTVDTRVWRWLGVAATALSFLILPDGTGLAPLTKLPGALFITAATVAAAVIAVRRAGPSTPTVTTSSAREQSQR
jgi:hypothetical protein